MSILLSKRTNTLVKALFDEPLSSRVENALIESVGSNIPFCENETPEGMERIRFAVMKLIKENEEDFSYAIELAYTDWRDLLMDAGFGHKSDAHMNWYHSVKGVL